MEDIRTHTGYSDILQLDTPNDLLSRSSRTILIAPLSAADSFNLIVDNFDDYESYIQTQQRECSFWLQNFDESDQ